MQNENAPKILLVDDDLTLLRVLARRLAAWKYQVITAENGHEGLRYVQAETINAAIIDLYMPEMDGLELLRNIRETSPDLPVIILSGQGELHDAIKALRLGAWDYIYKPVKELSFLRLALERVLEKARLLEELALYRDDLEKMVAQQNEDLLAKQKALVEKTASLEEVNHVLKALLDQREIEKKAIEQSTVANLKRYVFPYLDELDHAGISPAAKTLVDIIRKNIEQLITPVSKTLSGAYQGFTPSEVRVADLIRQGKSVKDIAVLLHISPSTVEKHRNKIRRKLKLIHTKTNLCTYLNSLT